jgi:hypothetical protein
MLASVGVFAVVQAMGGHAWALHAGQQHATRHTCMHPRVVRSDACGGRRVGRYVGCLKQLCWARLGVDG